MFKYFLLIIFSITLAHQTQKGTRPEEAAALAKDILESDPKKVSSGKKENEDDVNSESDQKHEKSIAAPIVQSLKSPSRNEDEDYEDEKKEAPPATNTMKVVRTNVKMAGSTTMKTLFSTTPKKRGRSHIRAQRRFVVVGIVREFQERCRERCRGSR